jgi:hypothetical protein
VNAWRVNALHETGSGGGASTNFMRLLIGVLFAAVCLAQATLKIPPTKASVDLENQRVEITLWGTVSPTPSGTFALALTVDLGDFQEHLTPILAAHLNRSDRCGDRMTLEKAAIAPSAPSGLLTANVNFERYGCVKAFGKEVTKRLVGGHGVIEVNLTPSVEENDIAIAAEVRKVDADGSLGQVLRSGSVGDSIREKIAASVESSLQKSVNLKSTLPPALEKAISIETVRFADGGDGRLWLTIGGEVRLSAEQLRGIAKELGH